MKTNDYSLLRPVDLTAAERGELLYSIRAFGANKEHECKFVAGTQNEICVLFEKWGFAVFGEEEITENFRMAPLAWVEGKPVYKGDVLYWTSRNACWKVTAVDTGLQFDDKSVRSYSSVADSDSFTWTPREVSPPTPIPVLHEVRLLAWLSPKRQLVWIEEDAEVYPQKSSRWKRVPSEDKIVEVEEPAVQEGGAA